MTRAENPPRPADEILENGILTKHRLMLSAAAAALLAGPMLVSGARGDTDITTNATAPLKTSTSGNITLETSGAAQIKSSGGAITIDSNNYVVNNGAITNLDTNSAIGVLIDTTAGNIVVPTNGLTNNGSINVTGTGTGKAGISITGGNIYFGDITATATTSVGTSTTGQSVVTTGGSSISVQGDSSNALILGFGTTMDGNVTLAGPVNMSPSDKSSATGAVLIDLEGTLNGNFIVGSGSSLFNTGTGAIGLAARGAINACDTNARAGVGLTCASTSTGSLIVQGSIQVVGTTTANVKGGNPESGSAVVIGSNIGGGILFDGPKVGVSANSIATSTIIGNGTTSTNGTNPVLLIDPGQSASVISLGVLSPIIIGPVQNSIDTADGFNGQGGGYSFINRGTIQALPIDKNNSSIAVVIEGQTSANYTCLSGSSTSCVTNIGGKQVGGLLNTGTIVAQAATPDDSVSSITANALVIGGYATVPRIVVAGELTTGSSTTPGTISAGVNGPGGGSATAIAISNFANVPEVDVLAHGTISASINTTTPSPTSVFATSNSPFTEYAAAIVDQSGSLLTINNAGVIAGINTVLTPGSGAVTSNTQQAINLLANTSGGITINNSGNLEGDVYFGAAGNNDTLNVGNTGASGTANPATGITNTPYQYATISGRIDSTPSGVPPVSETNTISFGAGTNQTLHVGGFGYVNSVILSGAGGVNVTVDPNGQLYVANTSVTGPLYANKFDVNGGVLGLSISQGTSSTTPVVQASSEATLSPSARIGLQFGTFISSGTSAASVNSPTPQTITLISAPAGNLNISSTTLAVDNAALVPNIPFLFESPTEAGSQAPTPLSLGASGGNQTLLLTFLPRAPGLKNADGTAGLGLSGDAYNLFSYTAAALANDPTLGAAIASGLTVTNGVGVPTLNVDASQVKAQQIFSQFTPDVSGGTKQIAIMITDQATGPVAARQRLLNSYANVPGELTLWGNEFSGMINNKGRVDASGSLTNYKDHGWGFVLGADAGSPRKGWYGGALTFYSGDVSETTPRSSLVHEEWYMLTGYTDWRGKHVFFDSKVDVGYGNLDGHRTMAVGDQTRDAQGKRASLLAAVGGTAGAFFNYGIFQVIPHISLDGMTMREEGYSEVNGGNGLDLQVAPYYANSLRIFLGSDLKTQFGVWGINMTPEFRLGYHYDVVGSPVKLKAGFISTGGLDVPSNVVTFVGPDPDTGNVLAGASLSAGNSTWSLGVHYDWLRGNNASTTQIGMVTLLGRI